MYSKKLAYGFLILILFLSYSFKIKSVDWLITTSGNYILDDDIFSTGDATNGTIRIQSSYVNLDLNGRVIYQSSATASCNGIQIDAGVGDVKISNGYIKNFTQSGIVANAGCNNLYLQNLIIDGCQVRGIDFNGTSTIRGGTNITESSITNCKIINSSTATTADFVLSLSNCARILVSDCVFSTNGGATTSTNFGIVTLTDSSYCSFVRLDINSNSISTAHQMYGVYFNSVAAELIGNYFVDCIARNNMVPAASASSFFIGFQTSANSEYNVFKNCQALNNSANAECVGFSTPGITNTFIACIANGNNSTSNTGALNTFGFLVNGANASVFMDCVASNNFSIVSGASGSLVVGFLVQSSVGNVFLRCVANYNLSTTTNATAAGMYLFSGTVNTNEIKDCEFIGNTGSSAANSYGIRFAASGSSNAYLRTTCAFNGTTGANQTSGVNAGAVTATTSITSASVTAPWTTLQMPT